jgi:hypothetical protein
VPGVRENVIAAGTQHLLPISPESSPEEVEASIQAMVEQMRESWTKDEDD